VFVRESKKLNISNQS